MTGKADSVLRFNDCELDVAARELRKAGELEPLEPRVYALLVYLYEQRHRAVGKDEIQNAVWKGTIVSETALTRAIMKARRAVNDNADKQAVIRTVHGHGYQFVATLEGEAAAAPEKAATPGRKFASPSLFAGILVLVIVAFAWYLWPGPATKQTVRLAIMPVENASEDRDYAWTRLGLMGFANDLFARGAEISILPASDVIRFAEQIGLSSGRNDVDAEDLERLKANYGGSHMLMSKLEKNAGVLRLSYALHYPDGGVELGTMVGAEPTELMRGVVRSVTATLSRMVRAADNITVVSEDPFINEAYSRGLSFSLEGRCNEALEHFQVVISSGNSDGHAEYEWANCARILGRWQDAEEAFEKILADLPAEPASSLRASALNGLGTVYLRSGRRDLARDTFLLGLGEAESAGDPLLQSKLLNSLAIDARNRREFDEARALIARAMLAHSEADAGALPGQLPAALANIDMAEGKFEQADKHLQDALAAFRAIGDRRNEAMMLNNYGYLRRQQGRPDEAEPLHLQSLEIRKEIGDLVGQGIILGMLSTLYENDGRLDEAKAAATEAFRITSEANDKLFMATSLAQLAQVEHSMGDRVAARREYAASKAIFLEIDDFSRAAQTTIRMARIDMASGDFEAAKKSTQEVLEYTQSEALHEPAVEAMELMGDIARAKSDLSQAVEFYQEAISYSEETGFVGNKIGIVEKLANTLIDLDDTDAAQPLIGYLIEQDKEAESLKLRARVAFVDGDIESAVALMKSAMSAAGEDWSEADSQTLAGYREAADGD